MKAYYLRCDWKNNNLLYVPNNLIFIEEGKEENGWKEDMFDIDYAPESFKILRKWDKKGPLIVRNTDYFLLKEIDVPDKSLEKFRDACFNKRTLEAYGDAIGIFLKAKQMMGS